MDEKYARHGGDFILKFDDIVNELKDIYVQCGGEASAVANITSVAGMLDKVEEVAGSGSISKDDIPMVTEIDYDTSSYECNKTYAEFKAYVEEFADDNNNKAPFYMKYNVDGTWSINWILGATLVSEQLMHENYLNVPASVTGGIDLDGMAMGSDDNFYMFNA